MIAHYAAIKTLHISCVILSLSLFVLRGRYALRDQAYPGGRLLRVLPHLVDTVLLGSALLLCFILGQYPFVQSWLSAKLLALLLYIAFGHVALHQRHGLMQRRLAFVAALLCAAYIVGVALSHDPRSYLAL